MVEFGDAGAGAGDDESHIRALVATWMQASKDGDLAKIATLMTDDVVFLTPGRSPFGKAAFLAAQQSMAGLTIVGTNDIVDLHVCGDWAYLSCHLHLTITPPAPAASFAKSGYTLTVVRRDPDGCWRIARDANLLT
jgi:uncharacterized protein (TIGR02246 family)